MGLKYLKRAIKTGEESLSDVRDLVQGILTDIEKGGDEKALEFAQKFDKYDGQIMLTADKIAEASEHVSQRVKDDIQFAYDNVKRFAEAQKASLNDFHIDVIPEFTTGQKHIPCNSVGCYIPGGRYSHIASAIMTVTTAKVAGCNHITACSPPRPEIGINPAIIYTANLCGADTILAMGGVQAISAMAFGLFGLPQADILVGPGNQYVAEAKRLLFGRVGLDMVAGPTDSLVLADETADPEIVSVDLVGQAEHGYNSPVWLVTNNQELAEKVLSLIPKVIEDLPELNKTNAAAAWRDFGEVIVCSSKEEMALTSDNYAPEHLSVQANNLEWWLDRLKCYGSLFLGEETTVAYGDKASGTNHVLPTARSARYTGGLSVHKYMKVVTWQKATREGSRRVAEATARISRSEGMEGHARTADIRLKKYFPDEEFDLMGE